MPNVTTSNFIAPHLGKNPRRHPCSRLYLHKSTYSWNIQFAHLKLPRAPHIITITSSYPIEAKVLICHIKKEFEIKNVSYYFFDAFVIICGLKCFGRVIFTIFFLFFGRGEVVKILSQYGEGFNFRSDMSRNKNDTRRSCR